jgi:DNA-binding MarR family transcriptional regulator
MVREIEEDILRSLRRISRAIDLHSRKLFNDLGLTGPQLVVLRTIARVGPVTPSAVAREVSLSQATVTGIIDRLEGRQLVIRGRSDRDRRLVTVSATDAGQVLVDSAPSPLQDRFVERLAALPNDEQEQIREALSRIVIMMGSEDVPAAAVLSTSSAAQSPEEAKDMLAAGETDVAVLAEILPGLNIAVPDSEE